jgi:hypothetical protein
MKEGEIIKHWISFTDMVLLLQMNSHLQLQSLPTNENDIRFAVQSSTGSFDDAGTLHSRAGCTTAALRPYICTMYVLQPYHSQHQRVIAHRWPDHTARAYDFCGFLHVPCITVTDGNL